MDHSVMGHSVMNTFEQWFYQASSGLALAEKQRIGPELRSHYLDALQYHQERGLDQANAAANALTDLGDPLVCNQSLRKRYLNEDQYQAVYEPLLRETELWQQLFQWIISIALFCYFLTNLEDALLWIKQHPFHVFGLFALIVFEIWLNWITKLRFKNHSLGRMHYQSYLVYQIMGFPIIAWLGADLGLAFIGNLLVQCIFKMVKLLPKLQLLYTLRFQG
jgi:hypothetical protein